MMSHTWLIKRKVENLIQNDLHTKSHTSIKIFTVRHIIYIYLYGEIRTPLTAVYTIYILINTI